MANSERLECNQAKSRSGLTRFLPIGAALAAGAMALPQLSPATVIFNDTMGSSSVNPGTYPTPTATSTGYDVLSAKATTDSIAAGDLQIKQAGSTGAITEVQANFVPTSSPIALNVGDMIDLIVTFTDNGGILNSGTNSSSALYFGLYSANGSSNTPLSSLSSSGLTASSGPGNSPAGVSGYVGYVSQLFGTGNTGSRFLTRPAQSAETNVDQDLVAGGASSSGGSYVNGVQVGSRSTVATTLNASGGVYTEDLNITLTAAGAETLTSTLYNGVGTGGTVAATFSSSTSASPAGQFLTSSFDTLAFGWYSKNTGTTASQMDVSNVQVVYTPVPEPASMGLVAVAGIGLMHRRRRAAGTTPSAI